MLFSVALPPPKRFFPMSDSQPIDLSELQSLNFRPDWVEEPKSEATSAAEVVWNFQEKRGGGGNRGRDERGARGDRTQSRGPRKEGGSPRPQNRPGTDRPAPRAPRPPGDAPRRDSRPSGSGGGGGRRSEPHGPRQDRGDNRRPNRDGFKGGRPNQRDERRLDDRPALPEGWFVRVLPEPRALDNLSKQIKASGRAYSVYDVAKLFLSGRDRYLLHFYYKKPEAPPSHSPEAPDATAVPAAPSAPAELLQCTLDGSLWLTRDEAIRHLREGNALNELYREEIVDIDPPKGNFQAIAVCGFSGVLLAPPNHHSYPVTVARLHREQFSNMPLDRYKARIKIEKGEEIVQKWIEQQSKQCQFVQIKVEEGAEPARFKSLAERDTHFLKNHAEEVLKSVREITVGGNIPGKMISPGLFAVLRMELDRQNRFPMHLVQELCRELESHGLRFFKRGKKATFVCRSRPQFIGAGITLSERVRSIVEMVRANPGISYGKVVSTLAPPVPPSEPTPAAEAPEAAESPTPPAVPTLSPAELAIMQDIKWLVQEGYLTEFSNGELHVLGRQRPHDDGSHAPPSKPVEQRKEETQTNQPSNEVQEVQEVSDVLDAEEPPPADEQSSESAAIPNTEPNTEDSPPEGSQGIEQ